MAKTIHRDPTRSIDNNLLNNGKVKFIGCRMCQDAAIDDVNGIEIVETIDGYRGSVDQQVLAVIRPIAHTDGYVCCENRASIDVHEGRAIDIRNRVTLSPIFILVYKVSGNICNVGTDGQFIFASHADRGKRHAKHIDVKWRYASNRDRPVRSRNRDIVCVES